LNDIKATDSLTSLSHFEFDEYAPYFTELAKANGARRTDFKIVNADGSVLRVEYKGSKAASPGNPINKLEFMNDVMILLDKGEDFVWVLDKGHDLSKTANSMKNALKSEQFEEALLNHFKNDKPGFDKAMKKVDNILFILNTLPNKYLRKGAY
jgi:hypothetical protein